MIARRAALLGLALLGSCTTPATELVVVVDSPLSIPDALDAVEIVVTGPAGLSTGATEDLTAPDAPALPLTLGVSPGGEALGPITVMAIGLRDGEVRVTTAARVTLTAGESRVLTLFLVEGCAGRTCPGDAVCAPGGCRTLDRADLPAFDGTPPRYAQEDPCDAMPWDADGDGEPSVTCGGADCDDGDASFGPEVVELCDGIDNDCDGLVDPDCDCAPDEMRSCTTACGSMGEQTCDDGVFGECVPPAETCSGADDDCDGLIDEGQDYAPQAVARLDEGGGRVAGPRVVAVEGGWRVVYTDREPEFGAPMFAARDGDGDWTSPVSVSSFGAEPELGVGDGNLLLAFTRTNSFGQTQVRARPLDLDGVPLAGAAVVESNASSAPRLRVLWDGSGYTVGYYDGNLFLYPLDAEGALVGPRRTFSSEQDERADFAYDSGRVAGTWARNGRVYFGWADVVGMPMQRAVGTADEAEGAALDAANGRALLAWYEEADGRGVLRALPVEDTTPGAEAAVLSMSVDAPGDAPAATVRFGDGQYLIAWSDTRGAAPEIYFARFSDQGVLTQSPTRLSTGDASADEAPAAAYRDGRFGVVWMQDGRRVRFAEVGCPG